MTLKFCKLLFLCIPLIFSDCKKERNNLFEEKQSFFRMDTRAEITVLIPPQINVSKIWYSIDSILSDWETRFSQLGERSEVARVNDRQSSCVNISKELGLMIDAGVKYGDTTNEMFDITIYPLKELWGLGESLKTQQVPDNKTLNETLKKIDYRKVKVNETQDTVCIDDPNMEIDLGGLAKAWALQEVAQYMDRKGISHYLISCGDIISKGFRLDGKPWFIGIQHPRKPGQILAAVPLDKGVIFTSGDYERYWEFNGKRIHHIFNPKTGQSCTKNQSLTIWSKNLVEAKLMSTGLFCFDKDTILSIVKSKGMECLIVDSSGEISVSEGWKKKVELQ